HETLMVLDAPTGQNGFAQARMFHEAIGLTGVCLTKLDGTAKGGIVVRIVRELKVPVKLIGLGERVEDLQPFDSQAFVDALVAESGRRKSPRTASCGGRSSSPRAVAGSRFRIRWSGPSSSRLAAR